MMPNAFLTARADVEILGKILTKDDISQLENHMEVEKNYYAVSLNKNNFILDLIKKSGVFAVNFSSIKKAENTPVDGKYFDKFQKFRIGKKEAEKINCPLIAGADVLECELNHIMDLGERALIIGNILKKHKV